MEYKYRKQFTVDGESFRIYAQTLEELYEKKAKKELEIREHGKLTSSSVTVKEWGYYAIETYKKSVSDEYREQILGRFRKHVVPVIGNQKIKDIKPIQCQEILNAQIGMSKSHITQLAQEMAFIFHMGEINGLLRHNPMEHCVKPKSVSNQRRSITEEEREHLMKVCEKERFLFFLFMLQCGCRAKEVWNLQGKDIIDKGNYYLLHIRGTKTSNSDRFVPLPISLWERVKNCPEDAYIVSNKGNKYNKNTYKALSKALKREMNISMGCQVFRNALIPPLPLADDFIPYLLRHTYCTDLQKKGIDVRTAQKLMGHADISTTANIYTHQDDELMEYTAGLLDAITT